MKIAIVADWLTNLSGAEKVIEVLWRHFNKPPIYTTIHNPKKTKVFQDADVRTSFLNKFPGAKQKHQLFLKWMPKAVESLDLDEFDVVISSSHSCAKDIATSRAFPGRHNLLTRPIALASSPETPRPVKIKSIA